MNVDPTKTDDNGERGRIERLGHLEAERLMPTLAFLPLSLARTAEQLHPFAARQVSHYLFTSVHGNAFRARYAMAAVEPGCLSTADQAIDENRSNVNTICGKPVHFSITLSQLCPR